MSALRKKKKPAPNLSSEQLSYDKRTKLYKKGHNALKRKIVSNFLELIALFLFTAITLFLLSKMLLGSRAFFAPFFIALAAGAVMVFIMAKVRDYQFSISRFDKEDIYKQVSKELHEEAKQ